MWNNKEITTWKFENKHGAVHQNGPDSILTTTKVQPAYLIAMIKL